MTDGTGEEGHACTVYGPRRCMTCMAFPFRYREVSIAMGNMYVPRSCVSISELGSTHLPYGEFDTVGVVMNVVSSSLSAKQDR